MRVNVENPETYEEGLEYLRHYLDLFDPALMCDEHNGAPPVHWITGEETALIVARNDDEEVIDLLIMRDGQIYFPALTEPKAAVLEALVNHAREVNEAPLTAITDNELILDLAESFGVNRDGKELELP